MTENVKLGGILRPEEVTALITQVPQMPLWYFNFARTAASFYDVRLFLGQGQITAQGQQSFVEQVCVVMSIEFARTLRDNLSSTIDAYEKAFGKLRTEPAVGTLTVTQAPASVGPDAAGAKNSRKKKAKSG